MMPPPEGVKLLARHNPMLMPKLPRLGRMQGHVLIGKSSWNCLSEEAEGCAARIAQRISNVAQQFARSPRLVRAGWLESLRGRFFLGRVGGVATRNGLQPEALGPFGFRNCLQPFQLACAPHIPAGV